MKRGKLVTVVAVILLCCFPLVSCGGEGYSISYDESGNKIVTIDEGIGHVSMLFPDGYTLSGIDTYRYFVGDYLDVRFSKPGNDNIPLASSILICIEDHNGMYTAEESWRYDLDRCGDATILDQSMTTVMGVPAYQLIYYDEIYPAIPDPKLPQPEEGPDYLVPTISWYVYFDYGGYLYSIRLHSCPPREEEDMEIFGRVLESFTILE